ncbi:MAG: radical SAM protein, partial [Pseudonocardia sp.]|nr:radical SAM protein [Pseudonocardia sp.]
MTKTRNLTVLWALRSPCNLGCDYCYFGTLEEHRDNPPTVLGALSHLPHGDLSFDRIAAFLTSVERSRIGRVFLAGGEPLIWPRTLQVIEILTRAGVEVVVCTNGLPLNRRGVRAALLDLGVSAVSVSLDSADPGLNDRHRRPRHEGDGWHGVVAGITALLADRNRHSANRRRAGTPVTAVGVYTVITRETLPGLVATARFAADLGVDYFV